MTSPDAVRSAPPEPKRSERVRVVYIVGARNCGSTLLDAILGNAPGACGLGEAAGFYRYRAGTTCACGASPAGCRLCHAVEEGVTRVMPFSDFDRVSRMPLKERRAHWMLKRTGRRAAYVDAADSVYDAVAAFTGCSVLIDSSKNVTRAVALSRDSRHAVSVVHLVRDGRGHARSRRTRASAGRGRYLAPLAVAEWLAKNLMVSAVLARRAPSGYLLCRYEDLVSDPAKELRRLGAFAALDTTGLAERSSVQGVERRHLFEPARRVDYRRVRLDPARLESQRWSPRRNLAFWLCGGFLSARWGYDRKQSYLTSRGSRYEP